MGKNAPSMKKFNWSKVWAEQVDRSSHKARIRKAGISSEEFWDKFATWGELHSYTNYPCRALDRILKLVGPESTVIDVGAGSGTLTVPLAKVAKHVTAVEPSPGQIARLIESAERMRVKNLTVIQKRWEDVDAQELGCHEIVTAAYCFQMEDIKAALDKMYYVAKKCVFLLHLVDHDLLEPLRDILGGFNSSPDYIYLYNVLYEMGHRASLEVFTRVYEIPLDFQLDMLSYSHDLSTEHKDRLRDYLEANGKICSRDGTLWIKRQHRDALIWLLKEEK